MSIQKDYYTKNFDLAVPISCDDQTSRNDTDIERILNEMGAQSWINQEANEACPSRPFILHGPLPRSQDVH